MKAEEGEGIVVEEEIKDVVDEVNEVSHLRNNSIARLKYIIIIIIITIVIINIIISNYRSRSWQL